MRLADAFKKRANEPSVYAWVRFGAVAIVMGLGIWLGYIATGNEMVRLIVHRYGFAGVFLVSLVCGFNIAVPVPAVAFIPLFLASGLDFYMMIAVMVAGETTADLLSFALGRTGRDIDQVRNMKVVRRLERYRKRHYWQPLAIMAVFASVAPLPNEVLAIPLGIMGYPVLHVLVPVLIGNTIFTAAVAFGMQALLTRL